MRTSRTRTARIDCTQQKCRTGIVHAGSLPIDSSGKELNVLTIAIHLALDAGIGELPQLAIDNSGHGITENDE